MKFLRKLFSKIILLFILLCIATIFIYMQNNHIEITNITYQNSEIPFEFDGFKILHISDLHNKEFGDSQKDIIEDIQGISPDIIVITGDLIDKRRTDADNMEVSLSFVEQAIQIAPIYFTTGNHEAASDLYPLLKKELKNLGVIVLEHDSVQLRGIDTSITLVGMQDPLFYGDSDLFEMELESLINKDSNSLNILLTHRPELIDTYAKTNVDLVLSGHAHGGQIRLPFIGGIIAPGQGLFPKYTTGLYHVENTALVVSRGLGNSRFPIRILNRPELLVITLESN